MLKKLRDWIKHPHGPTLVVFYVFTAGCIAGAILFTIIGQDTSYGFVAYIFYALAAVTLGYTVYSLVVSVPAAKRKITEKLKANKLTANVLGSYDFKTTALAFLSFVATVAFAAVNLAGAIRYRLIWYGAVAAYYFVLIVLRGGILAAYKKCAEKYADRAEEYEKSKWRIYLAGGAFLIVLELAMSAAVTQMTLSERPAQSGEIMAIATAAYTFYKTITAVYNLIKAHKFSNPVTQSLRNLNFAAACMSVVSLTVLMISTFDSASSEAMQYLKSAVGFVACAAIIAMAAFMIIRAKKKLKSFNGECENER
ncbi:MAG: hypothetical protein K2L42_06675 [Clostridia bacterium]|nr:hypothetical protein [Clostridia bacterium]